MLQTNIVQKCPLSPNLLTVPLEYTSEGFGGRFRKKKVVFTFTKAWNMAVFVGPSAPGNRGTSVTVFPLPSSLQFSDCSVLSIYKAALSILLPNLLGSMDGYNLLWEVGFAPRLAEDSKHWQFEPYHGHLCLLNLGMELNLTWFTTYRQGCSIHRADNRTTMPNVGSTTGQTERRFSLENILFVSHSSMWQKAHSERMTGELVDVFHESDELDCLHISFEATLKLGILVEDILRRRSQFSKRYDNAGESQLEWKCQVIDVSQSRFLNLLIVFSPGKARIPVAVVVSLDLRTNTYQELDLEKEHGVLRSRRCSFPVLQFSNASFGT
jgi:hypothetical protein